MKSIKYALIGFGGIAESRLAREGFGLATGERPRLAALIGATDLNSERRQAAEALGLKWYRNFAEVLADPEIDALFIATSNSTHAEIALQAMAAGKHCLVEKPMATELEQARAMVEKARRQGLSLAVDHMMTKNVFNLKSQEFINSGQLGEVNDFCLHMEFLHGAIPEEAAGWRCSSPAELGGPIGDVGSHCLYMAEFLFESEVVSIDVSLLPRRLNINVEDAAVLIVTLDNGLRGTIRLSFAEPRGGIVGTISNLGYEIYGDRGVLRGYGTLFQLSGRPGEPVRVRLEHETEKGVVNLAVDTVVNIYTAMIDEHAQSILDRSPLDGQAGLHNLELVLAACESARKGTAVSLANDQHRRCFKDEKNRT